MMWNNIYHKLPTPYKYVTVLLVDGDEDCLYMYPDKSWAWNQNVTCWKNIVTEAKNNKK